MNPVGRADKQGLAEIVSKNKYLGTLSRGDVMEKRSVKRHEAGNLHQDLNSVQLVLQGRDEIDASVVDISPQGFKVSIPPSDVPFSIPQVDETVDVFFNAIYMRIKCRCIYATDDKDGNLLVGLYVSDPDDEIRLRIILDKNHLL